MSTPSSNHYTSTFTNFITQLLLGHNVYDKLDGPRVLYVYNTSANELVTQYENSDQHVGRMSYKPLAEAVVRTLDQTYDPVRKTHLSKLITTIDGEKVDESSKTSSSDCSIALVVNTYMLIACDLPDDTLTSLTQNKQRMDIEWTISLANQQTE